MLKKIHNRIDKFEKDYKKIEVLKDTKEKDIENTKERLGKDIEEVDKEIENKFKELESKLESEKNNLEEIIDRNLDMVQSIETKLDSVVLENKDKIVKDVKIDLDLEDSIIELSTKYSQIEDELDGKINLGMEFVERVKRYILDIKTRLDFRQKIGLTGLILIVLYIYRKYLLIQSTNGKVKTIMITILLIGVIYLIIKKYNENTLMGNKKRLSYMYNLIEHIKILSEKGKKELENIKTRKLKETENVMGNLKATKMVNVTKKNKYEIESIEEKYLDDLKKINLQDKIEITESEKEKLKENECVVLSKVKILGHTSSIYFGYKNLEIINETDKEYISENIVNGLIKEMDLKIGSNKIDFKMVDSVGLGSKYKKIISDDKINISKKIYVSEKEIIDMLDDTIDIIGERIQKELINYTSIEEYNNSEDKKLSYKAIFVYDIEKIENNDIISKITKIAEHGKNSGVILILVSNEEIKYMPKDSHRIRIKDKDDIILERYYSEELNYSLEI